MQRCFITTQIWKDVYSKQIFIDHSQKVTLNKFSKNFQFNYWIVLWPVFAGCVL